MMNLTRVFDYMGYKITYDPSTDTISTANLCNDLTVKCV